MTDLEIEWNFDFGRSGVDEDPASPLRRALRAMMVDGRPQKSLRLLFFTPALANPDDAYWFGALIHSRGDRIVFFPTLESGGFQLFHGKSKDPRRSFRVDHLTLQNDHRHWHISGASPKHRTTGPGTVPLDPDGYLWFGMSVAHPRLLRPVRRQNSVKFEVPDSDVDRRMDLLHEARQLAVDNILGLNPLAGDRAPPSYIQFNLAVGPKGFSPDENQLARWGANPTLDTPTRLGETVQLLSRLHRIDLSDDVDVLVEVFPVPLPPTDDLALMAWG